MKPNLYNINSYQLHAGNYFSESYLNEIISATPVQAVIIAMPDSQIKIDRALADPNDEKLIFGFMPLTYTSAGNTPSYFRDGVLIAEFSGKQDPDVPLQYSVKYWFDEWKSIVYKAIDNAIEYDYDGIFLDSLSSDSYWFPDNRLGNQPVADATELLAETLKSIRDYIDQKNIGREFYLIGNSPVNIGIQNPESLNYLDAIFNENLYASLDSLQGDGTNHTKRTTDDYQKFALESMFPVWNKSTATILGHDYRLQESPSTVLDSFLKYNDLGIVFSVTDASNYGSAFKNGPYYFMANDSQPVINGVDVSTNFIGGGHSSNATLIGGGNSDYIAGGVGRNTIQAGFGDDTIFPHPTTFDDIGILDIDINSVVINAPNPKLNVYINGILVGGPLEITPTGVNEQSQHIRFDLSSYGEIRSIDLEGFTTWVDETHQSAVQPSSITFNGLSVPLSAGTATGAAVIDKDGKWCSLSTGGKISFSKDDLPAYKSSPDVSSLIDGGDGFDCVIYNNSFYRYSLVMNGGSLNVKDSKMPNCIDTISDVERLQFSDLTLALDTDKGEIAGSAYRIYKAAFDRTPDAGGLGFWINAMDDGASLTSVAAGFINSPEFQKLYGAKVSDRDYVTKLYNNVLDRNPDQGGYDFWLGAMAKGLSREDVLVNFSESKENIANVADLIANGIQYQEWVG